mmetsp:Transcript_10689/g.23571  ORF Transcript_10689/g.23571 Transcript_10689/m.23571 type:complete len:853 (-) Transcript_10689:263-2821(-)|eukprot:CAMPEP_0206471180 /NCGR_PEP_ID=MMETSP0324_2-20121206/31394_1 /ASSEMBLY_ACC=CAM_ASM_000836 /TAXON_ID=2866 /ORGANISM="Crypthecodinium cohnii, Strain Seligo" /LENGTH=852 /DNA_ID=CAMNT_0053945425 /DNA_START=73 /DNA_END=2631 /DNA_ORIENTATION=+
MSGWEVENTDPNAGAAAKPEDPWQAADPWGGSGKGFETEAKTSVAGAAQPEPTNSVPAATEAAQPAATSSIVGRWQDDWSNDATMDITLVGDGKIKATWVGQNWDQDGTVTPDGKIEIMGQKAELCGNVIKFENEATWTKLQGGADAAPASGPAENGGAPAAAAAPEAAAAAAGAAGWGTADAWWSSKGGDAKAWDTKATEAWGKWEANGADSWKAAQTTETKADATADAWSAWTKPEATGATAGVSEAWANWGKKDGAAAEPWNNNNNADWEDAQKRKRQKDFKDTQDYYISQGTLPGKTEAEMESDEQNLFLGSTGAGDMFLYDDVPISMSGERHELIQPLESFEQMFQLYPDTIPKALEHNIKKCKYNTPTPVQKYAIPAALAGRDVMCCAQTGSGKTIAFLIPCLASMMKHTKATGLLDRPFEGPAAPDTLVLSPTRELCVQIYKEAEKFFHRTQHRAVRIYGQEDVKSQIWELAKGCDFCVATPGRFWDFCNAGIVDLKAVQCLVFDEADRMLQMDEGQGEAFIRKIIDDFGMPTKEHRQTLMFSATFPDDCQKLAMDYLFEYIWLGVGHVGGATSTVAQQFVEVDATRKMEHLIAFINNFLDTRIAEERLLIFTNSKVQAKGLDDKLFNEENVDSGALHGDLTQAQREENLRKFRVGEIDVMIATDLASRGLDITGVSQVLNYDVPFESDVYVQRIGRTGRIGRRGIATTFIETDSEGNWSHHGKQMDTLKALPKLLEDIKHEVPEWLAEKVAKLSEQTWGGAKTWGDNAAAGGDAGNGWGAWGKWDSNNNTNTTQDANTPGWGEAAAASTTDGASAAWEANNPAPESTSGGWEATANGDSASGWQ